MKTFVIAEAGVNHNGSLERALEMVEVAARSGADAIKFQTFRAEHLVVRGTEKAKYQKTNTGEAEDQFAMLKKLELPDADFVRLAEKCREVSIEFMSTPFGLDALKMLVNDAGMKRVKIASGEITNAPLLLEAARAAEAIVLSTGMTTVAEIEAALGVLAYGFLNAKAPTSTDDFVRAFQSEAGKRVLRERVTVLHCTSMYPAPLEEVNLLAMGTLHERLSLPIGYSDHTLGTTVSVAAVALGATVIEKHFTLDRALPGPDHVASLTPEELTEMVKSIREVERSLGSPEKLPSVSEMETRKVARKSIVAARPIRQGSVFELADFDFKRPGTGLSPYAVWGLVGKTAPRDYGLDDLIEETK